MGKVSYKLMHVIILRNLRRDLQFIIDKYKKMAEDLDKNDPQYTEKLLEYSTKMFDEMNQIQDATQQKYKKELESLHGEP